MDERKSLKDYFHHLQEIITGMVYRSVLKHDGSYTFLYVSPSARELFGLEPGDLLKDARLLNDLIHPEDREKHEQAMSRSTRTLNPWREELRYRTGGETRWYDCMYRPERQPNGEVQWDGVMLEISDRKRIEEALRTSESFLNSIIEQSPMPMWISDEKGTLIKINQACCDLLHLSAPEVVGKYNVLRDNIVEENGLMPLVRRVFEKCEPVSFELTYDSSKLNDLQLKSSASVVLETTIFPIRDGRGRLTNAVIQHIDITARRSAEAERAKLESQLRQMQKMESVGRLAGGVAHDFNNMLSVILGYTELIKTQLPAGSPLLRDLQEIETAAGHSRDITRQLLAFSRKQIIAPKLMNLNDTILDTRNTLSRLIGEDIDLSFHPGSDLWTVKFDPTQMNQILVNLGVNARDAMPDGGRLTIETQNIRLDDSYAREHLESTPGDFVMLAVSDEGSGMDHQTLSHLFEPFFTTKEGDRGTGLGLATIYGIVKQNGGFINVYSEPGQGTTFKIFIPRCLEEIEKIEIKAEASPASGSEAILLVEDNDLVRKMAMTMLQTIGYQVLVAKSPEEAVLLCETMATPIDLLITDVVMPGTSGVELWEKVTSIRKGLKVLFMSGFTPTVITQKGLLAEGFHFIQKPFNKNDLAKKVREAIGEP